MISIIISVILLIVQTIAKKKNKLEMFNISSLSFLFLNDIFFYNSIIFIYIFNLIVL